MHRLVTPQGGDFSDVKEENDLATGYASAWATFVVGDTDFLKDAHAFAKETVKSSTACSCAPASELTSLGFRLYVDKVRGGSFEACEGRVGGGEADCCDHVLSL